MYLLSSKILTKIWFYNKREHGIPSPLNLNWDTSDVNISIFWHLFFENILNEVTLNV